MHEPKIAIIAALPREIAGLVRGTRPDPELRQRGIHLYRIEGAVVVAAGMGPARVTLSLEAALRIEGIELIISTGLAGACSPNIHTGEVIEAATVVDAKTGERFPCAGSGPHLVLITTQTIAGIREKARLRESYNAALVDMEAATVARLALARAIRFRAIKGISDAHDFEMEAMSRFVDAHGHFRTAAFALHTALHPQTWSSAARLGRESNRALTKLWAELRTLISSSG